ncbi:MAG TPA: hypothetical protein VKT33_01320 [Candidatus Angelobacter sp.]|nr:hypothetical protein [Candidatus Angelobacter sp.]
MNAPDCVQDISAIEKRIRELSEWLKNNAGNAPAEQRHLDEGSQERIYWHYGYMVALKDMLRFMTGEKSPSQISSTRDSSTSHGTA